MYSFGTHLVRSTPLARTCNAMLSRLARRVRWPDRRNIIHHWSGRLIRTATAAILALQPATLSRCIFVVTHARTPQKRLPYNTHEQLEAMLSRNPCSLQDKLPFRAAIHHGPHEFHRLFPRHQLIVHSQTRFLHRLAAGPVSAVCTNCSSFCNTVRASSRKLGQSAERTWVSTRGGNEPDINGADGPQAHERGAKGRLSHEYATRASQDGCLVVFF